MLHISDKNKKSSDTGYKVNFVRKDVRPGDRRVQKSITAVKSALFDLILEVGFRKVTIGQITERANVGRSTFYLHFKDKEDVLRQSLDDLEAALAVAGEASQKSSFVLPLLRHVDGNRPLWRSLAIDEGEEIVTRRFRLIFANLFRADAGFKLTDSVQDEARVQILVGALLSVTAWWLDVEVNLTAEEVCRIFADCMLQPS